MLPLLFSHTLTFLLSHPLFFLYVQTQFLSEASLYSKGDFFNPDFKVPERVIAYDTDSKKYLVKWTSLPYAECSWEVQVISPTFFHPPSPPLPLTN